VTQSNTAQDKSLEAKQLKEKPVSSLRKTAAKAGVLKRKFKNKAEVKSTQPKATTKNNN
jgi:hypothetical protein